jgi:hypothetical protein
MAARVLSFTRSEVPGMKEISIDSRVKPTRTCCFRNCRATPFTALQPVRVLVIRQVVPT